MFSSHSSHPFVPFLSHHSFPILLLSYPLLSYFIFFHSNPFFYLPPFFPPSSPLSAERPQPPRKLYVPQDSVESRRLRLHWLTGGSGSSPLRYFTVQVKQLPNGDWSTHVADVAHNVTAWTLDRYTSII